MYVLVVYDVATSQGNGQKRLSQVAKECEKYGQRVQNSVFECKLDPAQLKILEYNIEKIIDSEFDNIRIYNLGKHWAKRIDNIGRTTSYNPDDPFIL